MLSLPMQRSCSPLTSISRHGKFRPTLMKLVSSNEPAVAKTTVQRAIELYRESADVSAALAVLTELKGIGPATASLLLAVHDPQNVVFFADEAFYWLCCGGTKGLIKYNVKEYKMLCERAQKLARRLGATAVDVERVAFVLMRQAPGASPLAEAQENKTPTAKVPTPTKPVAKVPPTTKRKVVDGEGEMNPPPLRRSKRGKQA